MENQQLEILNNQKQVLLSARVGDGTFYKQSLNGNYSMVTTSIHLEYLQFKKLLLEGLSISNITTVQNNGYKKGLIHTMRVNESSIVTDIFNMSIIEMLNNMDELGIALWFYDDGSLHNTKFYYNLSTHSSPLEDQYLFIEFLKRYNINAKIRTENKKDGRIFHYLSIGRYDGSNIISDILSKYPIKAFAYKIWSSETIQEWSNLQEEMKSENFTSIDGYRVGAFLKRMKTPSKFNRAILVE